MKLERDGDLYRRFIGALKPLAGLVLIVLLIAGAFSLHDYLGSFYYQVCLDGQVLGAIKDPVEVKDYVLQLRDEAEEYYGMEVVQMGRISAPQVRDASLTEEPEIVMALLKDKLDYKAWACEIQINGSTNFLVKSDEDYEKALMLVKESYIPDGDEGKTVIDVFIEDDITVTNVLADPTRILNAEDVATVLVEGRNRRQIYLVSRGDTLSQIAQRNSLKTSELREINPQLNGDSLQIGDQLNLSVVETLVNVVVVEEVTKEERIPFKTNTTNSSTMLYTQSKVTTKGEYGLKEVTYRVTSKNGVEIEQEILNENVIKQPVTQEVVKGTARPVVRTANTANINPTGQFGWPSAARRITSYFGARGRGWHSGIDIAGPTGTAIYAADSGVVTFSGFSGGYGRTVIIDHGKGSSTLYAHNSSNLVSVGSRVTKGQTIARIGTTGNATGAHVHFEIRINGTAVNPMRYY